MKKYYAVHVVRTGKPVHAPATAYGGFGEERKTFKELSEVKEYLSRNYSTSGYMKGRIRREKMYRDLDGFSRKHIGYIYTFRNPDYPKGIQQDWIEITEVKETTIII